MVQITQNLTPPVYFKYFAMGTITDEQKVNALIEGYKMINEEVSNYQKEMIRCFLYSVVVLAIGLGYGIKEGDISAIIEYMPFALLGLTLYFLTLGTMYVIANRYKARIETKVNRLAGEPLFEYESKFKPEFLRNGLLRNGRGKRRYPLPNVLLGVMMAGAFLYLASRSKFTSSDFVLYTLLGVAVGSLCIYVFIWIPAIIEKRQRQGFI